MVYLDPATEPPMGTGCRAGAHIVADRPGFDLFRGRREHPATRVVIGDSGRSWAFRLAPYKREVAGSSPAPPMVAADRSDRDRVGAVRSARGARPSGGRCQAAASSWAAEQISARLIA